MPVRPDLQQLEKCIDDALRRNDFKPLRTLFQIDIHEDVKIKCSKQFLHKLDDLICREFNKKEIQTLSAILISIGRCGKNISILGQSGLLTMIKQGLVPKEIILSRGQSKDEAVINMTEDLFDLLMVIYDICDEDFKKMNAILDKMPQDARKILCTEEMLTFMSNMGERILNAGDYDLQVGIVEALCRMTSEKQRQELACQWFPMDCIAKAFKGIKDCDFETDCRVFLNLVNGMLGDKRSVFTFPCLSAFLDKYELQIPSDEKLEEFWIDFNLGSHTLSFYIAGDDDDHQWEAVTVPEEKVHIYSIEVRESKKILSIIMKNVVKISKREGKELLLYFDASLEIMNVTQKLFGANKYKEFTRKQSISVAKTSVHIIFDASGSQILVPESQSSPIKEDLVHFNEKSNLSKSFASPSKHIDDSNPEDRNSQNEITTPRKRKMSEASMNISDAERYPVRSPVLLINTSTPRKRIKPPLQITSSTEKADIYKTSKTGMDNAVSHKPKPSERRCRGSNMDNHIKIAEVVEKTENKDTECPDQNFNELQDSQAVGKIDQSVLPNVADNICRKRMHSKWACWTPVTTIKLCNNQRASIISDIGVSRKCTRPKLSISVDESEETQKVKYRKEMTEPNKTDKAEDCKRISEQQSHPKGPEPQRSAENARPRDWHVESETTFKSVLLNKTTEESLIYEKKCILSKDMNTTVCDKNPSLGKNVRNHTKSVKELTSECNSCNLKQKPMREKSKGSGFTDAAESLINQINKRYNPTDNRKSTRKSKESLNVSGLSNKSGLQLSKVRKKSYRKLKTTFINVTSECPLNDVYNFSLNGANEPVIKLGMQEFQSTAREASMDNSLKLVGIQNYDGCEPSHKTKDKRVITSHEKKMLFSDTETEYGCDDGKTDISWLGESKSKRQLIDYSRNKNVKKYRSRKSRSSLEKGQPTAAVTDQQVSHKSTTKKEEEIVPDGRTRLPRRATKTKKNYKDISTSESESEQEFSHSLKEKEKLPLKEETIHSRTQTMKLPKKQQKVFSTETPKEPPKEKKGSPEQQDYMNNNSLDLSFLSASGSSSVEVLRCIEKITERDFTQDYDYITKSLSPYPKNAPPESSNSSNKVGGLGNSLKNNDTNSLSARESCSPIPRPHVVESHAASPLSMSSERREKIWVDMTSDNTHGSGPSHHHSRKQMYIEDYLSDSDEGEEPEGRAHLLPGRICQTEDADYPSFKGLVSESMTSNFPISEDWQYDLTDARMISKAINSDYKRKMDTQHKILDDFMNQTCTMIEDHMKTLDHEVVELRAEKLEKFHLIIVDEMKKHEKDAQSMKDLEKDLLDFGEKTLEKLRAYHKNDRERIHLLMTSLDKISVFNTDHEEAIFTSKMSLVKENMKMLQERLLQEMHEKDLLDIRRGLDSIFRPHEGDINM